MVSRQELERALRCGPPGRGAAVVTFYLQTGCPFTTAMLFPGGHPFGCGAQPCAGGGGAGLAAAAVGAGGGAGLAATAGEVMAAWSGSTGGGGGGVVSATGGGDGGGVGLAAAGGGEAAVWSDCRR